MTCIYFRVMDVDGEPLTDCGKMNLHEIKPGEEKGVWGVMKFLTLRKAFVVREGTIDHLEIAVKADGKWKKIESPTSGVVREGGHVSVPKLLIEISGNEEVEVG